MLSSPYFQPDRILSVYSNFSFSHSALCTQDSAPAPPPERPSRASSPPQQHEPRHCTSTPPCFPPLAPWRPGMCTNLHCCLTVRPAGIAYARHRAPPRYTKCACGGCKITDHIYALHLDMCTPTSSSALRPHPVRGPRSLCRIFWRGRGKAHRHTTPCTVITDCL